MFYLQLCCARWRIFLVVLLSMGSAAFGAYSSVDLVNGPEQDLAAMGRIYTELGGEQIGLWTLETSVKGTDFSNAYVFGGSKGVQYTMLNQVFGSDDVNEMKFTALTEDALVPQISLMQSPYFQDSKQWNGGNLPTDVAQFTVRWEGGGLAAVQDPLGQFVSTGPSLQSVNDGASEISSGTTLTFSDFQIFNSDDAWSIDLPTGASSVEVDWGSSQPTPQSDLTREWLAFDVSVVPEPDHGGFWLFTTGMLALGIRRRAVA